MRALIATVLYCVLLAVTTSSQSVGSEPSPMEAFASHQGVRTTWSNEVARWEQEGTRLVLTAVVLEASARKFQGVKVDLSSENARDQVYLDEQATERTRLALVEISDSIALTAMPGASGCMGAKEFWAGYDWPWNMYHELNVDFCGDSKNPVLVLHGRGKPGSFRFHGKSPTVLAEILATAMQKMKQQGPAQNEVAEACPVTKPPAQPFMPPPPYWIDHGGDQFWYGTESLWTLLGVPGTWNIHGNVLESKDGYSTKLTYWRRGFDWRRDKPELTVFAKRLDREAPIVAADPASAVFVTTDKPAMMTGIDIPSLGCWKVTAEYQGNELSFVVSVQP